MFLEMQYATNKTAILVGIFYKNKTFKFFSKPWKDK